jgi:hypothetical protein
MKRFAFLIFLASLSFAAPAHAQLSDPAACVPYRANWERVADGEDVAAMGKAISVIPSLCPALSGEAKARQAATKAKIAARDPCDAASRAWRAVDAQSEDKVRELMSGVPAGCTTVRALAQAQLDHLVSLRTRDPSPSRQPSEGLGAFFGGGLVPAFAMPNPVISIAARNYTRGANVAIDACASGPGFLTSAKPCAGTLNVAEYDIVATTEKNYEVRILYAAQTSRPVRVIFNGVVLSAAALTEPTGGWDGSHVKSNTIGAVRLRVGTNTIRLEGTGDGAFPSLREIHLLPNA